MANRQHDQLDDFSVLLLNLEGLQRGLWATQGIRVEFELDDTAKLSVPRPVSNIHTALTELFKDSVVSNDLAYHVIWMDYAQS